MKSQTEIHRVRSEKVLNTGASVPVEFKLCHSLSVMMHSG